LGEADSGPPYLQVEIYRPGSEIAGFTQPQAEIAANAAFLDPVNVTREDQPLDSKLGPFSLVSFATGSNAPRQCLGFVRAYDDPRLQISGWFCQEGALIERSTLACALDRLTLLAAGSEPKVGALFAQAELHRSFCGQRDPLLAATSAIRERILPAAAFFSALRIRGLEILQHRLTVFGIEHRHAVLLVHQGERVFPLLAAHALLRDQLEVVARRARVEGFVAAHPGGELLRTFVSRGEGLRLRGNRGSKGRQEGSAKDERDYATHSDRHL
jgi:hypothetical protein